MKISKKDVLKVIAAIRVYGTKIYGKTYSNIDCGKGNLYTILKPKGFSVTKIRRIISIMAKEEMAIREKSDNGGLFYVWNDKASVLIYLNDVCQQLQPIN